MSETTFENAKVGDKVWDVRHSYGIIENISKNEYGITVSFNKPNVHWLLIEKYTIDGFMDFAHSYSEERSLFWEKPKFEIPTRPRQKKILKGWIGFSILTDKKESKETLAITSNIYEKNYLDCLKKNWPHIQSIEIEYEE